MKNRFAIVILSASSLCLSHAHAQGNSSNTEGTQTVNHQSLAELKLRLAVPLYSGPLAKPKFHSLKGSGMFRTTIRRAFKQGVNFAGHYRIVTIGCGTGCMIVYVGDLKSGTLYDFPLQGEPNYMLHLDYGPQSQLLVARWVDSGNEDQHLKYQDWTCVEQYYQIKQGKFALLHSAKIGSASVCEE